ncbi:MAG: hypothetical protein UZ17_ACD001002849 [Acidobacteria bacterium OLB17]|nr:MAG: hypothetical protein UZ17_ACD001002849 [Acidobacteria bacterium OLB17]
MKEIQIGPREVILALDVYFRIDVVRASPASPEIVELSELLNRLPFHHHKEANPSFRNPVGVHMILCNFLALDPNYPGVGLNRGSRLQKQVWSEFCDNIPALSSAAKEIRAAHSGPSDG